MAMYNHPVYVKYIMLHTFTHTYVFDYIQYVRMFATSDPTTTEPAAAAVTIALYIHFSA